MNTLYEYINNPNNDMINYTHSILIIENILLSSSITSESIIIINKIFDCSLIIFNKSIDALVKLMNCSMDKQMSELFMI